MKFKPRIAPLEISVALFLMAAMLTDPGPVRIIMILCALLVACFLWWRWYDNQRKENSRK